jgi:hypothetical protein
MEQKVQTKCQDPQKKEQKDDITKDEKEESAT